MHKENILIVEDKDEFRKIYGDRLRFGGYDVLDATDGDEALKVVKEKKVDLIMTDINMPNKNGFELLTAIKADPALKDIPVIVMSVFDQLEYLKKSKELGAADYLVKGMHTPNQVLERIQALLPKKTV